MKKVMIVDDEFRIREGLHKIIEWEEYDAKVIAEAKNGKEALEKIREEQPDIMVLDMDMPVMDGIELIKIINREKLPIQIIVLSGYDHFEYVKTAMRYGAVNYLLKPVDSEELVLTLTEIIEGMKKKKEKEVQEVEAIRQMRANLLNRVINGDAYTDEFEEKMQYVGIELEFENACVSILEDCGRTLYDGDTKEKKKENEVKKKLCIETLEKLSKCIVFQDKEGRITVIHKNLSLTSAQFCEGLTAVILRIKKLLGMDVIFSVGEKVGSYKELHLSYKQAAAGLDYMIVYGVNRVIFYEHILKVINEREQNLKINMEIIHKKITTFDKIGLNQYIDEFFDYMEKNLRSLTPKEIRHLSAELIVGMINEIENSTISKNLYLDIYDEDLLNKIASANNVSLLKDIVKQTSEKIIFRHKENYKLSEARLPREILDYVHKHYNDPDICLKSLAYQFELSATHLGRIFKSATGEYFTNYINQIRVKSAKQLLVETDKKIKDISEEVGFSNIGYFYTIFKKNTHCNPAEFRNM